MSLYEDFQKKIGNRLSDKTVSDYLNTGGQVIEKGTKTKEPLSFLKKTANVLLPKALEFQPKDTTVADTFKRQQKASEELGMSGGLEVANPFRFLGKNEGVTKDTFIVPNDGAGRFITKNIVEIPERVGRTIEDLGRATIDKVFRTEYGIASDTRKPLVQSSFDFARDLYNQSLETGKSDSQATIIAVTGGVSSIIADLGPVLQLGSSAILSATKYNPDLENALIRLNLQKNFSYDTLNKNFNNAVKNASATGDIATIRRVFDDTAIILDQYRKAGILTYSEPIRLLRNASAYMKQPLGSKAITNFDVTNRTQTQAMRGELPGEAIVGQPQPAFGLSTKPVRNVGRTDGNIQQAVPDMDAQTAQILRGTKGMTADDIMQEFPDIKLKKDVPATDVYGNKVKIPDGEVLTPYEIKGNKILLQDGETYIVSKSQFQNIKGNAISKEASDFAPELKGTEESIKGDVPESKIMTIPQAMKEFDAGKEIYGIDDEGNESLIENREDIKNYTNFAHGDNFKPNVKPTKYSLYQLPGGKDYKEVVIQASSKKKTLDEVSIEKYGKPFKDLSGREQVGAESLHANQPIKKTEGAYDEEGNATDFTYLANRKGEELPVFRSSHWPDDLNVIAHIRSNIRIFNGEDAYFLEELQSDWAREGRSKGFATDKKLPTNHEDLLPNGWKVKSDNGDTWYVYDQAGKKVPNKLGTGDAYGGNKDVAIGKAVGEPMLMGDFKGGIPNNPLLKNWQTLAIKRALLDAINSGAEYFMWINGEQTSARYNLATQVDNIKWLKDKKDFNIATVKPKTGKEITITYNDKGVITDGDGLRMGWQQLQGKTLDEVLGKGLADKIMEKESGTLSGEGLKFGGEWANTLYDKQVGNIVKDLTGAKIENFDLGLPVEKYEQFFKVRNMDGVGNVDLKSVSKKDIGREVDIGQIGSGSDQYIVTDILGDGKFKAVSKNRLANFSEEEMKRAILGELTKNQQAYFTSGKETFDLSTKTTTQQGIKLTPEIKAKIKGEAPSFQASGQKFETKPTKKSTDTAVEAFSIGEKEENQLIIQAKGKSLDEFLKTQGKAVYHGTGSDIFTEFDPKRIGSRDSGWFGKGFYFASTKGEAGTYGKNVIEAYVDIKKPFDFDSFRPKDFKGVGIEDGYRLSGMAKIVPEINDKILVRITDKLGTSENNYAQSQREIKFGEYDRMVKKENLSKDSKHFFDEKSGVQYYSYKDLKGEEKDYRFYSKKEIPANLLDYGLFNEKYKVDLGTNYLYGVEKEIADNIGDSFTERLKSLGYDGTMQSPDGDEYVAFYPNQIRTRKQLTDIWNKANKNANIKTYGKNTTGEDTRASKSRTGDQTGRLERVPTIPSKLSSKSGQIPSNRKGMDSGNETSRAGKQRTRDNKIDETVKTLTEKGAPKKTITSITKALKQLPDNLIDIFDGVQQVSNSNAIGSLRITSKGTWEIGINPAYFNTQAYTQGEIISHEVYGHLVYYSAQRAVLTQINQSVRGIVTDTTSFASLMTKNGTNHTEFYLQGSVTDIKIGLSRYITPQDVSMVLDNIPTKTALDILDLKLNVRKYLATNKPELLSKGLDAYLSNGNSFLANEVFARIVERANEKNAVIPADIQQFVKDLSSGKIKKNVIAPRTQMFKQEFFDVDKSDMDLKKRIAKGEVRVSVKDGITIYTDTTTKKPISVDIKIESKPKEVPAIKNEDIQVAVTKLKEKNKALLSRKVTLKPDEDFVLPEVRVTQAEINKGEKAYQKAVQKEAGVKPESTKISKLEDQVLDIYKSKDANKAEQSLGEMMIMFDFAEAGERIMIPDTESNAGYSYKWVAKPSTFPQWLDSDLRSKKLLKDVLKRVDNIDTLRYPRSLRMKREARIIDQMFDMIDLDLGVDTKQIRARIIGRFNPEDRKAIVEQEQVEKFLEKQAKTTDTLIEKEEKKEAHIKRAKQAEQDFAKQLAESKAFAQRKSEAIQLAKRKSMAKKGIWRLIKRTLGPIGQTDPTSIAIYNEWLSKRILAVEAGSKVIRDFKARGFDSTDDMQMIFDYQAGSKLPLIKEYNDDLWSEAIRRGLETPYREDFFTQVYAESPEVVKEKIAEFIKNNTDMSDVEINEYVEGDIELPEQIAVRLKMRPYFTNVRVFPDYKTAMAHGFTPKYQTIVEHFAHYRIEMEKAIANKELIDDFVKEYKFLRVDDAPKDWVQVKLPGEKESQWYASPELADGLNKQFAIDENSLTQYVFKIFASLSSTAQGIILSGGVPYTPLNYFSVGQVLKTSTTALGFAVQGDFKMSLAELRAGKAFFRSFSDKKSLQFFEDNAKYIEMMGQEGIDMTNRIGSPSIAGGIPISKVFSAKMRKDFMDSVRTGKNNLINLKSKEKRIGMFGTDNEQKIGTMLQKFVDSKGADILSRAWDTAMNRKTFNSLLPQMQVEIFKNIYDQSRANGMSHETAKAFAGKYVKNDFGLSDNMGRAMAVKNFITALFLAPRFRESLILIYGKALTGFTTGRNKREYAGNRSLIIGMIVLFALYQAMNYLINDEFTWDNVPYRKFSLRIPLPNEQVAYVDFMPSIFATPRIVGQAGIALFQGDTKQVIKQLAGFMSIPFSHLGQALANTDYFGRDIYKDTDSPVTKARKTFMYATLGAFTHPYFRELVEYFKDGQPLYQTLSIMAEFPIKFGNLDKESTSKFFERTDKIDKAQRKEREAVRPIYDKVQKMLENGDKQGAQDIVDQLSDKEYEYYKSIRTAEKTKKTQKSKREMYNIVENIQELLEKGDEDSAQAIVEAMSNEEYRIYNLSKKELGY